MPQLDSTIRSGLKTLPDSLLKLIESCELPGLADGPSNAPLSGYLSSNQLEQDFSKASSLQFRLCQSGLWLLAGDLDRSHSLSQAIDESEGSFWHGIMHRRENDFGNSKYWFRRVGQHRVFDQIADRYGDDFGDPYLFVDACADVIAGSKSQQQNCIQIQWYEWQALLLHCLNL